MGRIWLFSANKIKSSESFCKQPTQLIVELNLSLRHIIVTLVLIDRSDYIILKRHIHHKNVSNLSDSMVWYNMFIIFVMYCMLPVPVKWCTVCCLLTAIIHIIVLAALGTIPILRNHF